MVLKKANKNAIAKPFSAMVAHGLRLRVKYQFWRQQRRRETAPYQQGDMSLRDPAEQMIRKAAEDSKRRQISRCHQPSTRLIVGVAVLVILRCRPRLEGCQPSTVPHTSQARRRPRAQCGEDRDGDRQVNETSRNRARITRQGFGPLRLGSTSLHAPTSVVTAASPNRHHHYCCRQQQTESAWHWITPGAI